MEPIIKPFRKNLVSIRRSFLLTFKLKNIQKKHHLITNRVIIDNVTRWGSSYNMLARAFKLRNSINELIESELKGKNIHELSTISERTWAIVFIVHNYLSKFNQATILLQGDKYPTLNMCISTYIELIKFSNDFLKIEIDYDIKKELIIGINLVIQTLEEYFNKGSLTSFMSMVLDPRLKDTVYVRKNWIEDFDFMFQKYKIYNNKDE